MAKWEFLRPWGQVLASNSVDMHYTPLMRCADRSVFVKVEWMCWLSTEREELTRWDTRNLLTTFEVMILANERDQRRVRETMELFTMLAAVDNKVFKKLVAQYTGVSRFADHQEVVFPRWLCKLRGKVPSDDPVATQGSVTWGELFGLSGDSSSGFQNAMEKLKAMGLQGKRYLHAWARWEVESNLFFRAIWTSGKQYVDLSAGQSSILLTTEEFSDQFARFFSFVASPAAHLCAVNDVDKLVEAWRRQPRQLPDESVVNDVQMMCSSFLNLERRTSLNVEQLLAALIRSGLAYEKLNLRSTSRQIKFEAMLNFGVFIAVLLHQKPFCAPPRGGHNFSFHDNDPCRDLIVLFDCVPDVRMAGICSAIAGSSRIET